MTQNLKELTLQTHATRATGKNSPVQVRMRQTGPNQAILQLGIDYSRAQVPDRSYYADYCNVERSRVGFTLTFGKLEGTQLKLRTKIEVTYPEGMFQHQLWGSTAPVRDSLNQYLVGKKLDALGTVDTSTEKVQTFRANNVFIAMWIEEGVLDFYYISPRDGYMLQAKDGIDVGLEPVVRVVLDVRIMYEFFELCHQFVIEEPEPVDIYEEKARGLK